MKILIVGSGGREHAIACSLPPLPTINTFIFRILYIFLLIVLLWLLLYLPKITLL